MILDNTLNTQTVLLDYKHTIVDKICSEAVALNNYIKWYLAVRVSFKKLINTENIYCNAVFRSRTELKSQYDDCLLYTSRCV